MSQNSPDTKINYGFYDRLSAQFPSQIIIDVTEVCNLACIHCPHPEFKKSEHYSASYLDLDLHHKMIHEVRDHGQGHTQYIRYTSRGEPLIHPKIYEMMSYAKATSGVSVTLTTNGRLLRPPQVKKLLDTKIDLVDISLDAFKDETYKKIRVGGDLTVTRANVLNLIEEKKKSGSHLKVVLSYIEQPQNLSETSDFEKFWKDNGADYVVVRRLHSAAGHQADVAKKMWEKAVGIERRACVYPWERLVLGPEGHLAFCPADWNNGSSFADYNKTTVKEEWQGKFMTGLREAHLKNEYSCHGFCGQCPDWMAVRWPGEGRGYADMVEDFRREGAEVNEG